MKGMMGVFNQKSREPNTETVKDAAAARRGSEVRQLVRWDHRASADLGSADLCPLNTEEQSFTGATQQVPH